MKSESARRYIADIEPKLKQMYGQTILDYHVGWVGLSANFSGNAIR